MAMPEFIAELRSKVGHMPLWLSGATAVVLRGDEVLLVKRADTGEWTPVSGVVDPGEHPKLTATREVAEEAGVASEVERLVWLAVTGMVRYPNGDQTQYIDHVFRCRWLSGDPHPADGEATAATFFKLDALPQLSERHVKAIALAVTDGEVCLD
ncbi:MAG: NUDIX domain-containing protein [Propionibacteriaceae bacterium]|jgi:ADP-ribose pyrophosphatase YjhB (NUDIX family)|nr:NUDIX domain-containing protein [Propionibacteriaceae bacterium]